MNIISWTSLQQNLNKDLKKKVELMIIIIIIIYKDEKLPLKSTIPSAI
jgi:hypothetical protein